MLHSSSFILYHPSIRASQLQNTGESYLCVSLFEPDNKLFCNTLPLPQYWRRSHGAMTEIWKALPKQSMAKPETQARWHLKNHEPNAAGSWDHYFLLMHGFGYILAWLDWSPPSSTRRQPGLCKLLFTAAEKTQTTAYVSRCSCLCIFRSSLTFTKESWLLYSLLTSIL